MLIKRKRTLFLGGGAILVLIITVASIVKPGSKGLDVEVFKAIKGDVAPTVTADGLIAANDAVNISSQVMGEIISIPVKEGDHVQKGDLLVQINPDTYQRDVASAKANLDAAVVAESQSRVTLAQRQRDWDRAEDLFQKKIFSTSQRDDAKLALDQARLSAESSRAMTQQARAYFQKAQDNMAKTTMRSPIDGVVTAVNAKVGETAMMGTMNIQGTVILTVSDLSEIITEVQVDEADFPRLKLGQPAVVTVDALGGKQYDGKVIEIGASAQASAASAQSNIRQFKVKVLLIKPDSHLKPGVTARVKIIADRRANVERVPIGAVRTEEKSGSQIFYVFVSDKNKAAKKTVKPGLSDDLYTEVISGLSDGDQVVIGPYRILRTLANGDKLKPKVVKPEDFEKHQSAEGQVEVHVD